VGRPGFFFFFFCTLRVDSQALGTSGLMPITRDRDSLAREKPYEQFVREI